MDTANDSMDTARVSATECAGVTVVTLSGEVDIANIGRITETIHALPNTGPGLVVDLTEVRYVDSTAVSLLHDLAMRSRQRTQRLAVVSPPASLPRRVLELTGLDANAWLADQLEAAVRIVRGEAAA